MEGWEDESPSDDDVSNIENELYSMFYYHSMSDGIPEDLAKKYDVDINDFGVTISLKDASKNNENVNLANKHKEENRSIKDASIKSKEYQRRTNDRYIEGRNKYDVSLELQDFCTFNENWDGVTDKPKTHCTIPQSPPTFRSKSFSKLPRYFDTMSSKNETKKNKKAEVNHRNCDNTFLLNKSLEHILNNHKLPSSTPIHKKAQSVHLNKFNQTKTKVNNAVKKNCPDIVIIENKCKFVDLTNDVDGDKSTVSAPLKRSKNKKNTEQTVPIITISSESESNLESSNESDLESSNESDFESSNESESDFNSDENIENSLTSIVLNTLSPTYSNYCGIEINTNYNWKKTSSPDGWTKSMKRFYNKPSKELITFDYNSFLKEKEGVDWSICSADRWNFKRTRQMRCLRCHQEGHVKAKCLKVFSCYMCGTPGHEAKRCPQKICLKCGSKRKDGFFIGCTNCLNKEDIICNICGIQGHSPNLCTDAWRSFNKHNEEDVIIPKKGLKYCCYCAKSGHTVDDCRKQLIQCETPNRRGNLHSSTPVSGRHKFKGQHKRSFSESNFETMVVLPSNKKRCKFKLHSNAVNYKRVRVSKMKTPTNEKNKKRNAYKRIHMLRKSNKKKKFKPCLSATI